MSRRSLPSSLNVRAPATSGAVSLAANRPLGGRRYVPRSGSKSDLHGALATLAISSARLHVGTQSGTTRPRLLISSNLGCVVENVGSADTYLSPAKPQCLCD